MQNPRILIVDDQLGGTRAKRRNTLREDFCYDLGLQDITGDVETENTKDPIADAVFCRGQVLKSREIQNSLENVVETVRKGWDTPPRWALLLLDLQFIEGPIDESSEPEEKLENGSYASYFGMEILEYLWGDSILRDIPIVILSSMPRSHIEHRFAEHGVYDFIAKDELNRERLAQILQDHGLIESQDIVGNSISFLKCLREARRCAKRGNDNILLLGETGTGKELIAKYVHDQSARRDKQFIKVLPQSVPEDTVDDLLFGHVKGAYTGATADKKGVAEEADGGTLFLDEFGDLSSSTQSKLLRLLDRNIRETGRIGSSKVTKVDIQVVLASEKLDLMSDSGHRNALLYRVNFDDAVRIPPLRDRLEDVPLLAEHFVAKSERKLEDEGNNPEKRKISGEVMEALCKAIWSGNVRELESKINTAVRSFPGLRVLAIQHLRLPTPAKETKKESQIRGNNQEKLDEPKGTLPELLEQLSSLEFSESVSERDEWTGRLYDIMVAYTAVSAALLKVALQVTRDPMATELEESLKVQKALILATGNKELTATKAYDLVKRVFRFRGEDKRIEMLLEDPILGEAYRKSVEARRAGPRKTNRK